ncbi:MAG: D-Ala-D-Ala carboxypeptidase family metallohydrolase [Bacteroidales bacterium]|nr:D-Ala-D-Ala carboxypeptidase family metallohydrolase [Bacteroidales bacterium]
MNWISEHISYKEAVYSNTALKHNLNNAPGENHIKAMELIAENVFEPARNYFMEPILITSFFRSPQVNKAIGGSRTSSHLKGEAIDMKAPTNAGYTNADLFEYILEKLEFDQLIWECGNYYNPDWVHVGYKIRGNRKQILRCLKQNGKKIYKPM